MAFGSLAASCAPDEDVVEWVQVRNVRTVVPGPGLPAGMNVQRSNNNVAVERHDGRTYVAFRTGPNHWASAETVLYVMSSEDELQWRLEGTFDEDRDLREPQLVSVGGTLWLYYARLGTDQYSFEPGGTVRVRYQGPGSWSAPESFGPPDLVVWRLEHLRDGKVHMFGYTGGAESLEAVYTPFTVLWWSSADGVDFAPVAGPGGAVLVGGGTETSGQLLDDGSLVAVVRSDNGEYDTRKFGSYICTAPANDLGNWDCVNDPRRFDSPLLLQGGGKVWLVARRQVENDGLFDLGAQGTWEELFQQYRVEFSLTPKRCAIWEVDPETRAVTFVQDLHGVGDTCFPDAIPSEDGKEGSYVLYNYGNDPAGPDLGWIGGQVGETFLFRQDVVLR